MADDKTSAKVMKMIADGQGPRRRTWARRGYHIYTHPGTWYVLFGGMVVGLSLAAYLTNTFHLGIFLFLSGLPILWVVSQPVLKWVVPAYWHTPTAPIFWYAGLRSIIKKKEPKGPTVVQKVLNPRLHLFTQTGWPLAELRNLTPSPTYHRTEDEDNHRSLFDDGFLNPTTGLPMSGGVDSAGYMLGHGPFSD